MEEIKINVSIKVWMNPQEICDLLNERIKKLAI